MERFRSCSVQSYSQEERRLIPGESATKAGSAGEGGQKTLATGPFHCICKQIQAAGCGLLFSSGNALSCCAVVEALKDIRTPCELLSQGARHVQRVPEPRAQEELDAGRVLPRAGQVQGWVGTEAPSSVHQLQQY